MLPKWIKNLQNGFGNTTPFWRCPPWNHHISVASSPPWSKFGASDWSFLFSGLWFAASDWNISINLAPKRNFILHRLWSKRLTKWIVFLKVKLKSSKHFNKIFCGKSRTTTVHGGGLSVWLLQWREALTCAECEFVLSELCIIVLQADNIIHLVMGVG